MNAGATVSSVGHMYEGPADGDYVRYVDQLLARNAAHAVVHAVASQTLPSRPRQSASTAKAAQAPARGRMDLRTYGVGAQILRECGAFKLKLMGNPRRMPSMTGYGLEIVGYIDKTDKTDKADKK